MAAKRRGCVVGRHRLKSSRDGRERVEEARGWGGKERRDRSTLRRQAPIRKGRLRLPWSGDSTASRASTGEERRVRTPR
eukprot:1557533-Pleurochrysis_carterae.AAC.1